MSQPQIRLYNQLEFNNGIDTKVIKSKCLVESKKGRKEVKNRHNTQKKLKLTDDYLRLLSLLMRFRKDNSLTPECCECLIYMYTFYIDSGNGLTCFGIAKTFKGHSNVGSESHNVQIKLNVLLDRGLISVIGRSKYGACIYIPSIKAIEELSKIC